MAKERIYEAGRETQGDRNSLTDRTELLEGHHLLVATEFPQRPISLITTEKRRPDVRWESSSSPVDFDHEYLRLLIQGDPATEQHFTSYFGRLLQIRLRNQVRSTELIEDIKQSTFLRVLQRLRTHGDIHHPERLAAFVLGVCNNVAHEMMRQEQRHPPIPEGNDPADDRIDHTRELVNEERKALVNQVLGELTPKDRGILKMLFFDETGKDEICQRFGVDRRYLRVLLFRARNRFKAVLVKRARVEGTPA
jgi:RNA polymerase sigma factor (sigma-70 family)